MNSKKLIAILASISAAAAAIAAPSRPIVEERQAFAQEIIALYDINSDQALDASELEQAVESMYAKRNAAIKSRKARLEESGAIPASEVTSGVVTMYPIPEDAAISLLNDHDANQSGGLDVAELMGSMKTIRKMSLTTKPRPTERILEVSTDQQS